MKQILQSLNDGSTSLVDVPAPRAGAGQVLIRSRASLVSAGTERMLVEFGRAGWLERARRQPDKVRMVLDKIRTDGVAAAWQAVKSRLDEPLALGYCNVGVVLEVGSDVAGIAIGDRVASNGNHAELVCVPKHLCARVPDGVDDTQAAFTVLGAVALQGVRLLEATLGECVAVTGLGLVGLLALQILRAHGCRVLGIDPDASRRALAQRLGAEAVADPSDAEAAAQTLSRGRGVDAVLIAASTASDEPLRQAAHMCRQRGRIVLVGVAGLNLSRADFYTKELSFRVSCSYGPGRYDPVYEQQGHDYPLGFVRWTEQRNFEAVLDLMAAGRIATDALVSHRFPLARAQEAYALLASDQPSLGLLLDYPDAAPDAAIARTITNVSAAAVAGDGFTFLGAGAYARRTLMPAFAAAGARLRTVASRGGVSAAHAASKFGFAQASSDWTEAIADAQSSAIVIATRHDLHAAQVLAALRAGRHVFCEKPLCLTLDELDAIANEARQRPQLRLMVGFNRRFAPLVRRCADLLAGTSAPKNFVMTVNAGALPAQHWTRDAAVGGGRIVGEGCHFIDLLRHLARSPIVRAQAVASARGADSATLLPEFADGSVGAIHYLANGARAFPKERLEIFCDGRVLQLDNFRRLRAWGWSGFSGASAWRQDKGQAACAAAFVACVRDGTAAPIALDELIEVSRVAIELQQHLGA